MCIRDRYNPWLVAAQGDAAAAGESEEAEIAALTSAGARQDTALSTAIAEVEPGHA